jgi:hypothetical protein
MGNIPSGIDATNWHWPDDAELDQLKALGTRVLTGYISYDSSKDITAAQIKQAHAKGFGVLLNFESTADRALSGGSAGLTDGAYVRNRAHSLYGQVGHVPKSKLSIPYSVDFDTNPGQYPVIDAYLLGAQKGMTTEFVAGDYGEYDLIVHTAHAGTSHFEWQTYAWSQSKFASGIADYYQWRNSVTLKNGHGIVDFDQIIADGHSPFGAWWPPGSALDVPSIVPTPKPAPVPAPTSAPTTGDDLYDLSLLFTYGQQFGRWNAKQHPHLVAAVGKGLAAVVSKVKP